ncbi:DNA cytosine methyltransferase [Cohnella xylanilytica]|uniref:DNA (cytosine-5-)-methyltransferase n=1 Tax=Cohnella xylanilytica TaxID=557555 RepID=A0A841TVN3_9BACL|nr:DNA cytosine methyltransferase [Cohnella xylanilytica]MBB6689930.1 DNA cytosine methyltransferase [Cohnella xylanilytica]
MREIIVDNFAGGGGASTGIEMATGRSVDIAINHDPSAIAMHEANHPETEHYCESVWNVDPRKVAAGRPVGLCWLSPDCKHFSKAKGGKPVEKKIRGLAWVALRWAATVRPRVIMLENVEEFKTWGPLVIGPDGKHWPDPKQKGRTFNSFVNALRRQGYDVDWRELRACDYGAPTIRKRFFLIARRDGRPIVWPEPTHGDPESEAVKSGRLKPWRTASEIIDWSIPCPSIFERTRPLAENTMRRIARGIQRFVIENPRPYIAPYVIKVNHKYDQFRGQSIDEPFQTVTAVNGWGVVTPYIARIGQTGFGGDRLQYEADEPLTTITTKAEHLLVTPVLGVNTTGHPGSSPDEPLRTVTTGRHHMVISPTLIQMGYGERPGQEPRVLDLEKPVGTVTAGGNKFAVAEAVLAVPHITKFRGGATGHEIDEPLHTVTSGAGSARPAGAAHAMGMVTAFLAKHFGGNYTGPGNGTDEPLSTITTTDHNALVTAHVARHFGESIGSPADAPIGTVTAGGGGKSSLVTSHLVKFRGTCADGQPVTEPMPTITAGGMHVGEVRAFLLKYYGSADNGQQLDEPLHTVTTKDRFGLVTIEGTEYQIVDIGMRMLEPHELFAAQGFPRRYIIDRDADGNRYPKSAQVARCGNSVPPPFAEALVRANLPELCTGSGRALTFERYRETAGQLQLSI